MTTDIDEIILLVDIKFIGQPIIKLCSSESKGGLSQYKSTGELLKISSVKLNSAMSESIGSIELALEDKYIGLIKAGRYIGGTVKVSAACFSNGALLKRTILINGYMNKPSIMKTEKTSVVKITLSSIFHKTRRKRGVNAVEGSYILTTQSGFAKDTIFSFAGNYD